MTRCRWLPPPLPKETFAEYSIACAEERRMAREKKARPSYWPGKRFSLEALPVDRILVREDGRWSLHSLPRGATEGFAMEGEA
jgi:hypothetical protein